MRSSRPRNIANGREAQLNAWPQNEESNAAQRPIRSVLKKGPLVDGRLALAMTDLRAHPAFLLTQLAATFARLLNSHRISSCVSPERGEELCNSFLYKRLLYCSRFVCSSDRMHVGTRTCVWSQFHSAENQRVVGSLNQFSRRIRLTILFDLRSRSTAINSPHVP